MFQTNRGRSSGSPHIRQSSHPYDSDFQNRRTFSEAYSCGYSSGIETTFRTGFPITAIPRRCGRGHLDSTGSKGKRFTNNQTFPTVSGNFLHILYTNEKAGEFHRLYKFDPTLHSVAQQRDPIVHHAQDSQQQIPMLQATRLARMYPSLRNAAIGASFLLMNMALTTSR